jgi:hypothetical protein
VSVSKFDRSDEGYSFQLLIEKHNTSMQLIIGVSVVDKVVEYNLFF